MSILASTFRWLQRKRYQYEVTFSLYMLTPTEKFIFNSFLFLFFSMIIIALTLYLPQHVALLTHRATFYYNGHDNAKAAVTGLGGSIVVDNASASVVMVDQVRETVMQALGGEGDSSEGREL